GSGELMLVVATYLVLVAAVSLFFAPGARTDDGSIWANARYRTLLYPAHGGLLLFGAMACAAVGLRGRGTLVLALASAGILLAQTVDLTAYLRWGVPPFVGL